MEMYFGIKWFGDGWSEYVKIKEYLLTFPFKTTEVTSILKFDLKDLRRLKIQSLSDKKLKKELEELQKLLNDDTKIQVYGDKMPVIESMSTGTSGYTGGSGISSYSGNYSKSSGVKQEIFDYISVINEIFNTEILSEENLIMDLNTEEIVFRK